MVVFYVEGNNILDPPEYNVRAGPFLCSTLEKDERLTVGIFYCKDNCSPCFGVKAKLKKLGIAEDGEHKIEVVNISHDEEAFQLCVRNGVSSTPAMKVGDEWLRSASEILAWAKQLVQ